MFYILLLINFCIATSSLIYKNNIFLKKIDAFNKLHNLLNNHLKEPIILNGNRTPFKKDICHILCENSNMNFKEYTFDKFMFKLPHLKYENKLLYVSDYLIGNGRILNNYEAELLIQIPKTSNLIVFETENLSTIPYKDMNINRHFEIIEFPNIDKKQIVRYICDTILDNKYNDDLLLLNWIRYDIELLSIEKINILLFELNDMINEKIKINEIHKCINLMIDGLK